MKFHIVLLILNFIVLFTESHKVIDGNEVYPPYSYPYIGALVLRGTQRHFCGAILISPYHAITAAHCIVAPLGYDVYFHRHNETINPVNEGAIKREITRTVQHPRYKEIKATKYPDAMLLATLRRAGSKSHGDFGTYDNVTKYTLDWDFAILFWDDAVYLYNPVRLNFDTDALVNTSTTTIGWGATREDGPQSDVLMGVGGLLVWDNQACSRALGGATITDRMICAGGRNTDSCQGDSGGPLLLDVSTRLVGLVSWGFGCGRYGYPGVYARISAAEGFIRTYVDLPY